MYKSPLRYPGGKTRSRKILYTILIENFDIRLLKKIISPFFGGGSFEFYLMEKLNVLVMGNDKFVPLWQFWNICILDRETLVKNVHHNRKIMLNSEDDGKSHFSNLRNNIMNIADDVEQAVDYFIINRCSFSGATLSGGFSSESMKSRFTESCIERLKNLDTSKLSIENLDGVEFIEKQCDENNDEVILFVDPPYYLNKGSNLYGNNGDLHKDFDHDKLFESLKSKKRWILTYNNCDFIRNLYRDFKIIEASWTYGMNKSKKSSEIIIIST